jgi:UDP-N-acetylmuramoyl-tripeptide--D-alanyl-D-alanine ligase
MILYINDLLTILHNKPIMIDIPIKGISIDSRTIQRGEVFFALNGKHYDGHKFIKEAMKKGALAIVYSKEYQYTISQKNIFFIKTYDTLVALGKLANYYRKKFTNTKIIGITGSNGKTTTKEMLFKILRTYGKTIASKNNFNNRIGVPLSIFSLDYNVKYAVFELGSSLFGEINLLSKMLDPDVGLITNIGLTHLKSFRSYSGVFQEKKALFDNMKTNSTIILNQDDEFLKTINKHNSHCDKLITFSLKNSAADVYIKHIKYYYNTTKFVLCTKGETVQITLATRVKFNILNALAASTCAIHLGIPFKNIRYGLESFIFPKMRMETFTSKNGLILINDSYNANPSSMKEAVNSVLRIYNGKRIYLILGDMLDLGEKEKDYHFELGKFLDSKKNIESIYLLGNLSIYIYKALYNNHALHFFTPNTLFNKLKHIPANNNTVFFFKASRLIHMEEIYLNFCKLVV